jgi:hypothetical protein
MQFIFLVYLSNREPRKNKGTPSPEQIQSEIFLLSTNQTRKIIIIIMKTILKFLIKIQWTCNH